MTSASAPAIATLTAVTQPTARLKEGTYAAATATTTHSRGSIHQIATAITAATSTIRKTPARQGGCTIPHLEAPRSDTARGRCRTPKAGYDRDAFAYRQFDSNRNGWDVRNDVLRCDLHDVTH